MNHEAKIKYVCSFLFINNRYLFTMEESSSITIAPVDEGNAEFYKVMVDLVQGVKSAVDNIPNVVTQLLAKERTSADCSESEINNAGTKKKAEDKPAPKKSDKK